MLPLDLENDFLKGNIPAERLYSSMGFKYPSYLTNVLLGHWTNRL